jgi:hypothetical protein
MKTFVLASLLAFGLSSVALACADDASGKPCGCKDHHEMMHSGTPGGHDGCKDMTGMDPRMMGGPDGDDGCCGKGKHHGGRHHGHYGHDHGDTGVTKSTGGRPGRAF